MSYAAGGSIIGLRYRGHLATPLLSSDLKRSTSGVELDLMGTQACHIKENTPKNTDSFATRVANSVSAAAEAVFGKLCTFQLAPITTLEGAIWWR